MAQRDDTELTRTHRGTDGRGLPAAPPVWGSFRLLEELGRGAFGRVYHAWDATLARDIALKIVTLPDSTRAAAALHEGRMLARVRHRNVVTVYGAQQIGNEVGVWMELIRGRHLGLIVREHGPMGPEEATVIGINVCQALAAVHAAGLLHRDIKANNVMRESGGRIVLMDFGAGRETGPSAAGDMAGTPLYMAPEVLGGQPASPGSDLYSVGVLLFHAVTGEYPVFGRSILDVSLAHRRGQRRLLSDRRPDLPDAFVRVVERALAPSPLDRPASAGAMLRDLTNALSGSGSWERRPGAAYDAPSSPALDLSTPAGYLPARTDTAAPASLASRWVIGILTAFLGIGLLGFLMSIAFNQSLLRPPEFSTDRPVDWWRYGARSLVAPAVLMGITIMAVRLLVTVWHVLMRLVPPLGVMARGARDGFGRLAQRVGAGSPAAASQWLLFLQIVAMSAAWLHYVPFIEAVSKPTEASLDQLLALLGPVSDVPVVYRAVVTLLLLAMAAAWHALLSKPGAWPQVPRTTLVAGGAVMAIALLMLAVPYRLLYHNEMPRTDYRGARCYELGAHDTRVLLYCPDLPPPERVLTVDGTLPRRSGTIPESIFSAPPPPR